jgi:hypothetical protein
VAFVSVISSSKQTALVLAPFFYCAKFPSYRNHPSQDKNSEQFFWYFDLSKIFSWSQGICMPRLVQIGLSTRAIREHTYTHKNSNFTYKRNTNLSSFTYSLKKKRHTEMKITPLEVHQNISCSKWEKWCNSNNGHKECNCWHGMCLARNRVSPWCVQSPIGVHTEPHCCTKTFSEVLLFQWCKLHFCMLLRFCYINILVPVFYSQYPIFHNNRNNNQRVYTNNLFYTSWLLLKLKQIKTKKLTKYSPLGKCQVLAGAREKTYSPSLSW